MLPDNFKLIDARDAFGDPILLAAPAVPARGPRADKTGTSTQVAVKSGNPFRDPGSGTFGNGPAGAKTDKASGELMKKLLPQAQLYVTQMRNKTNANSVVAKQIGKRLHIELLKDGVKVASLDLPVSDPKASAEPVVAKPGDAAVSTPVADSGARDKVVTEARSSKSIDKLKGDARQQRLDDLVDYLYTRYNSTGEIFKSPDEVRINAPAGWDKKNISGLSDDELRQLTQRLSTRGWSDEALEKVLLPNIAAGRRNKILQKEK